MRGGILCGYLLVAWLGCWAAVAATQQPLYRSSTDAVLVDVQVTADRKPVTGLTAADFELKDMGVEQDVRVVSFADVPISLILVLDASASVVGERLAQLKNAGRAAVAALRAGDQATLLAVRDRVTLDVAWTSDHAMLNRRIDALEARGRTALHDAVFSAISFREQAAGRVLLLVFSDGVDTASWLDPGQVLEAARHSDVVITAVSAAGRIRPSSGREARDVFGLEAALRRWFDQDATLFPYAFLDVIAEETGGMALHVESGGEIAAAFRTSVADFKTRYLLMYTPDGVDVPGWHPIQVSVIGRRADVTARRGYWR